MRQMPPIHSKIIIQVVQRHNTFRQMVDKRQLLITTIMGHRKRAYLAVVLLVAAAAEEAVVPRC